MRALALDTPPDVEEIVLKGYRRMTPLQKLRRVVELGVASEALAAARIRARVIYALEKLDEHWAVYLNVSDLLRQALRDAGIDEESSLRANCRQRLRANA